MVTPVNAELLEQLLIQSNYDHQEIRFLTKGFKEGFDIGFRGDITGLKRTAPNLKLRVGNLTVLWNKVMKEVKAGRFAGPFKQPPFENFIQSPIGLVPKDGNDTRLIFHLSYPRVGGISVNSETPKELCSVEYPDFALAIRRCLEEGDFCYVGKSDMKSAFRNLGILPRQYCLLVMKCQSPIDGKTYWFTDKCLPFGGGISCSHFQRFSTAIAHLVTYRTGKIVINYLDDYLFIAYMKSACNEQIAVFLAICKSINFPVAMEKTVWAQQLLTFLGLLIDTINQSIGIPIEKVERAKQLIASIIGCKKTTVHNMQKLCGFLNFLCRCIVPGRAFTRRLYSHFSSSMKPHYHLNVSHAIKQDLTVWLQFLNEPSIYNRPFIDFSEVLQANDLDWYTDSSGVIGCGGYFSSNWFQMKWDKEFIREVTPSIEYLELYAVAASVLLWGSNFPNKRIRLFCDNKSVRDMINSSSSKCKNCMYLIRVIVAFSMRMNLRVFCKYVDSKSNNLADALSRYQMKRFWADVEKEKRTMNKSPEQFPQQLLPMNRIWIKH